MNSRILKALFIGFVIGIIVWAVTHRKPRAQAPAAETPQPAAASR